MRSTAVQKLAQNPEVSQWLASLTDAQIAELDRTAADPTWPPTVDLRRFEVDTPNGADAMVLQRGTRHGVDPHSGLPAPDRHAQRIEGHF